MILAPQARRVPEVDDGGNATFGKTTYAILFSDPKDYHGMLAWTVTVKRGDAVIAETKTGSAPACTAIRR